MQKLRFQATNENLDAITLGMDISEEDIVLAICGSGDQPFAIAEKATVIAVDINPVQIQYAKHRVQMLEEGDVKGFLKTDLTSLENMLKLLSFDYMTSLKTKRNLVTLINRNRYFKQPGRLDRIARNLEKVTYVIGNIFELDITGFSKVYLSHTLLNNRTGLAHLFSLAPEGTLFYATEARDVCYQRGVENLIIQNDKLTFEARKYESGRYFCPKVFHKQTLN